MRNAGLQQVEETLGADFAGVLVSGCLNIYGDLVERQHKCYAHHLKAIRQAQIGHEAIQEAASGWLRCVRARTWDDSGLPGGNLRPAETLVHLAESGRRLRL